MREINLKFYLASDNENAVKTEKYQFALDELEMFNQLYAERLLYNLDVHFEMYENGQSDDWNLGSNFSLLGNKTIKVMNRKHKLSAVSGNAGESLIIPSLNSMLNYSLNYCRISSNKKCPDFRIVVNSELLNLWGHNVSLSCVQMPGDLPLEVKSHWKSDKKIPMGALEQLVSYWTIMLKEGFCEYVGSGIIARVNFKQDKRSIRCFLYHPKGRTSKNKLIYICSEDNGLKNKIEKIMKRNLFI